MFSLTDLIVEIPNVLEEEHCNEIIQRFEEDDRRHRGVTGAPIAARSAKESTDLYISSLDEWNDVDNLFFQSISPHFLDYCNKYSDFTTANIVGGGDYTDQGYQIQKTEPDEYYHWHNDAMNCLIAETGHVDTDNVRKDIVRERVFTYILYLNDRTGLENGRTQFFFNETIISVEPQVGKLLLFPASPLYTHRGETLTEGVKYLMTGWCSTYMSTRSVIDEGPHIDTIMEDFTSINDVEDQDGIIVAS